MFTPAGDLLEITDIPAVVARREFYRRLDLVLAGRGVLSGLTA